MAGKSKGSKHKAKHHKGPVKHIHIRKADNGGFIVQNDHEPDGDETQGGSSEQAIANMDQLHQHLDASMGDHPAMPPVPDPAAAPPAAGPAAPPAPQPTM